MQVVTVSATYGAAGNTIGPAVAERLGLPFVDRAIPAAVAAEIGCTLEEVLARDDRAETGLGRLLANAARLPNVTLGGMDVYLPDPEHRIVQEEEFVAHTEQVIRDIAQREGAVVLGRAGFVVLADHPGALHVRLDGPKARRVARVAETNGWDEARAARELADNDRARQAYAKYFYRVDPASPHLYHLVLDSTSFPVETCIDLIVRAAESRRTAG
ncbi:MAG: cytidylate kinase-like family protein [Streptosporangiales bacterium]|nr:cytidylate kinase-like family protein [Streptosporangiales bacterium]